MRPERTLGSCCTMAEVQPNLYDCGPRHNRKAARRQSPNLRLSGYRMRLVHIKRFKPCLEQLEGGRSDIKASVRSLVS